MNPTVASRSLPESTSCPRVDVVAIDGPCGVGKSTVAREVAQRLEFQHLDTGAMYRAVAWLGLREQINLKDPGALAALVSKCDLRLERDSHSSDLRIWCNGTEVTEAIREREVSVAVSDVADQEPVRDALVARQRELGLRQPSVLEGRDITTVVFPDARWKFFLEADPEVRAERRLRQLREAGKTTERNLVLADLAARDFRDRTRPKGALKLASDATLLDTTLMPRSQVVDLIVALVHSDR